MGVALTRDEGLIQLLSPAPRSPLSSHNALGRSGSLRRSRHSASSIAERQLTSLLTSDLLTSNLLAGRSPGAQRRSTPYSFPEVRRPQSQGLVVLSQAQSLQPGPGQPAGSAPSSPGDKGGFRHSSTEGGVERNHNLSTSSNTDHHQTSENDHKPNLTNPALKSDLNPTSEPDSAHRRSVETTTAPRSDCDPVLKPDPNSAFNPDPDYNHGNSVIATTTPLSVAVDRRTLTPGPRTFPPAPNPRRPSDRLHGDQAEAPRGSVVMDTQLISEGEEGEVGDDLTSCIITDSPANHRPLQSQPTNEQSVPTLTSDQPVPVSSKESSLPASSTNELPGDSTSTNHIDRKSVV